MNDVATLVREVSPPTRRHKLHHGHFAFARALVQGLDTRAMWDRYLRIEGDHTDIRTVRKTIQWLRDEFAAAAKRHRRYGTARLVLIDADLVPESGASALPSLDQFIAERGMEDFSEAEQLEAYRDEYGDAQQRASRRARLIAKQLDALKWLENLIAEPPHLDDGVAAWLHPDLSGRLELIGILTLRQLVDRINGVGLRWWREIPAIGEGKAKRIVAWLQAYAPILGVAVGAHALAKRTALPAGMLQAVVPRSTAIVPIDKLVVPQHLSGQNGAYRLPQHLCLIGASNDYGAILAWVKAKHGLTPTEIANRKRKRGIDPSAPEGPFAWIEYLSNTQRAYLKEAERFLLWAIVQRQKPLSSMTLEDCTAYRDFLADPRPEALWCGSHARQRWSPLWRPFEGPLEPASQRRAVAALKSLYRFLVDQCYLRGNPWGGVATPKASGKGIDPGRSFTQGQWDFIEAQLQELPDTSANLRLRFTLRFLYATGLRLSEAVKARVADLVWKSYPGDSFDAEPVEVWELKVIGKGGRERVVPIAPAVIDELRIYLVSRGLPADFDLVPAETHLIGKAVDVAERAPWSPAARVSVDPQAGIGASTLHDQLKEFFARCALVYAARDLAGAARDLAGAARDLAGAARFEDASAHWLRHTHGSHSVAAGMDIKVVQQNLGHASLGTTTIYTTSEERRRAQETAKLWNAGRRKQALLPEDEQ